MPVNSYLRKDDKTKTKNDILKMCKSCSTKYTSEKGIRHKSFTIRLRQFKSTQTIKFNSYTFTYIISSISLIQKSSTTIIIIAIVG